MLSKVVFELRLISHYSLYSEFVCIHDVPTHKVAITVRVRPPGRESVNPMHISVRSYSHTLSTLRQKRARLLRRLLLESVHARAVSPFSSSQVFPLVASSCPAVAGSLEGIEYF